MNPFAKTNQWMLEEAQTGSPYASGVVLATTTPDGKPHSRIVDLRLLDEKGALFFTQKMSRKVSELKANPYASMTFWFPLNKRQVNIEGQVIALSDEENQHFWSTYSRLGQLKFSVYAPTSGQTIPSTQALEEQLEQLKLHYGQNPIPMSPEYVGFRVVPKTFFFYEYLVENISRRKRYTLKPDGSWLIENLSP